MTMGEKIVMCDKVCQAISKMECPTAIAPHQISGLDFERILQVMPWLIQKLALSRDSRASFVRRQGLLNYNRAFVKDAERGDEDDAAFPADDGRILELATMKDLVFRGKPKRVYLAQNNLDEAPFFDARRVHQCLKEYNDTSANAVFEYMLAQIAELEKEQAEKGGVISGIDLGISSLGGGAAAKGKATALNMEEDATNEDIIANVERMLAAGRNEQKITSKKGVVMKTLDMNEGLVAAAQDDDDEAGDDPNKLQRG